MTLLSIISSLVLATRWTTAFSISSAMMAGKHANIFHIHSKISNTMNQITCVVSLSPISIIHSKFIPHLMFMSSMQSSQLFRCIFFIFIYKFGKCDDEQSICLLLKQPRQGSRVNAEIFLSNIFMPFKYNNQTCHAIYHYIPIQLTLHCLNISTLRKIHKNRMMMVTMMIMLIFCSALSLLSYFASSSLISSSSFLPCQ